jgi:hypothetical protein
MSVLQNIWHDLVEKKLWPVAALLVVLIVAVPVALGKPGEVPAPPSPPTATGIQSGPTLALTATGATGFEHPPQVNKRALDPFASRNNPAADRLRAALKSAVLVVIDGGTPTDNTGGTPTPPDTSTPSTDTGNDPSTGDTPAEPTVKTEKDDVLTVLITPEGAEPTEIDDVRTLSPLPDADNPFLVYVGKSGDGKASFLVSSTVTVSGDGVCAPSMADCRTLEMGVGDTADFVVKGVDNTGAATVTKVEFTIVDLETKKVKVTGSAARAAKLENKARTVGALALKSVLNDDLVVQSLLRQRVKFRY